LELPDLQDELIGQDQFVAYLEELSNAGVAVEVRVRGGPRARPKGGVQLVELAASFGTQEIHAAQLRYVYQGSSWVDTATNAPGGVRLVRMKSN
jgi:hypothetical protein